AREEAAGDAVGEGGCGPGDVAVGGFEFALEAEGGEGFLASVVELEFEGGGEAELVDVEWEELEVRHFDQLEVGGVGAWLGRHSCASPWGAEEPFEFGDFAPQRLAKLGEGLAGL